jgi:hypothetical protein
MHAALDTLTPAEAAVVAGVSMRDVHRVIDEHILPEGFYDIREARSFSSRACVFIAFYFEAAAKLTAEERQRAITIASQDSSDDKPFAKIYPRRFSDYRLRAVPDSRGRAPSSSECGPRSGIDGR